MYWFDTSEEDPVEKSSSLDNHLSEEMIEEYCFNRLPEETTVQLEDHLLVCAQCRVAVEDLDEYILLMKLATSELSRLPEPLVPKRECEQLPGFGSEARLAPAYAAERGARSISVPRLSDSRHATSARSEPFRTVTLKPRLMTPMICATALGLTCLLGLHFLRSEPVQSAASVPLSAFRGGGERFVAHAPAQTPLDLQADIADLPGADSTGADRPGTDPPVVNAYRLEVVDVAGRPVWDQSIPVSSATLSAHVPKGLRAGAYWVRLYSRAGDLLREFSLRLDDPARHR
jgi:hypothetical protein